MYTRLSAILFPVTALLAVGAVIWGYQENQEKNSILIKAENQYQRAFHDLSFHVDKLNDELGQAVAVNAKSQNFHRKCLVNVWRLTNAAQNDINQLPLTLLPFNKTEEFLGKVANFSYRAALRKETLTDQDMKTIQALFEHSKDIANNLEEVRSEVIAGNLRWMDVETALASETKKADNSIIDGFKKVDKKISAYPETNWGPSTPSLHETRSMNALSGSAQSVDQIKQKAAKFLGLKQQQDIGVVENGKGTEFSSYSVSTVRPGTSDDVHLGFAKKGGSLLWFMDARPVSTKKLNYRQARDAALQFLDRHGYRDMTMVNYEEYDNSADIVFARVQNEVIIFPEKLTVKVALDNGEITGLQATDYVFEQRKRTIGEPKMSKEQAQATLNPKYKVNRHDLALIKNDVGEELLCHLFIGQLGDVQYRIFLNADSGEEESVEVVKE